MSKLCRTHKQHAYYKQQAGNMLNNFNLTIFSYLPLLAFSNLKYLRAQSTRPD